MNYTNKNYRVWVNGKINSQAMTMRDVARILLFSPKTHLVWKKSDN